MPGRRSWEIYIQTIQRCQLRCSACSFGETEEDLLKIIIIRRSKSDGLGNLRRRIGIGQNGVLEVTPPSGGRENRRIILKNNPGFETIGIGGGCWHNFNPGTVSITVFHKVTCTATALACSGQSRTWIVHTGWILSCSMFVVIKTGYRI